MPTPTRVKDCMRRNPLTINSRDNLVQAVETLIEYKLTGVTVTDDEGRPVGVLSELDCIKSVLNEIYNDSVRNSVVLMACASIAVTCVFLLRPLIAPGDLVHHPDELARD